MVLLLVFCGECWFELVPDYPTVTRTLFRGSSSIYCASSETTHGNRPEIGHFVRKQRGLCCQQSVDTTYVNEAVLQRAASAQRQSSNNENGPRDFREERKGLNGVVFVVFTMTLSVLCTMALKLDTGFVVEASSSRRQSRGGKVGASKSRLRRLET